MSCLFFLFHFMYDCSARAFQHHDPHPPRFLAYITQYTVFSRYIHNTGSSSHIHRTRTTRQQGYIYIYNSRVAYIHIHRRCCYSKRHSHSHNTQYTINTGCQYHIHNTRLLHNTHNNNTIKVIMGHCLLFGSLVIPRYTIIQGHSWHTHKVIHDIHIHITHNNITYHYYTLHNTTHT